jgi:ATP-dependent DNA helicase DinG
LPFPPPDDPLLEARTRALKAQGRDPFTELFLSGAAISLKQGVGRLIRSETDRGLLIICDKRLHTKSYGNRILSALPPMTRLTDGAAVAHWLDQLQASGA